MTKKGVHQYTGSIRKSNYNVINCMTCGYWHVNTYPSRDELDKYYRANYYEHARETQDRSMTDKIKGADGFYRIQ